jgi:hypothetical protein
MTRCLRLARGVLEFVVGEDWRIGLGVAISLALTALVADADIAAWWVMPLATVVLLTLSIRRAVREAADPLSREPRGREQ